ncbi:hypothetical protein GGF46_000896 [Coemansia sp. RSA 552]|nr:hypothetical protein GGF46_000896 [Coemansia sp. RSA 552]
MSGTLQFTAISGANNEDAVCYLLEIDDAKILLDCGSFEDYSGAGLAQLQRVAPQVDAVLLSHPDTAHVGAYPLAYSQYGLTCPAYATQATHMMGRLCMLDVVKTLVGREEFTLFGEKDVDAAFDSVTPLQYFQPKALAGKNSTIVITAYRAGHTVGGTIWTISNGGEKVLYALDFNHMREEHLRRCSLMDGGEKVVDQRLMRPTLLITDAYNAMHNLPTRKKRVEYLVESVAAATKRGSNVLIPVDSAARVLEIAYVLNEWWSRERGRRDGYALCLLAQCGRKMRSFAQSLAGWMTSNVEGAITDRDAKPFDLRHVTIVQSMDELNRKMRGGGSRGRPRRAVVLASLEGMTMGFSQELFLRWAADRKNTIILTQRGPPASLTRNLYTRWWDRTQAQQPRDAPMQLVHPIRLARTTVPVTVKKRVPLEGKELAKWKEQERLRKEKEAAHDALLKRKRDMLDNDDMSSASDSEDGDGDGDAVVATMPARDMTADMFSEIDLETERLVSGQSYDLYVRGRGPVRGLYFSKSYLMYPFQEKNRRTDEYGEIYDLEKYMVKAESDDTHMLLDHQPNEPAEDAQASRPTKPIVNERRVQVNCRLTFVDMEGRVDGTSLRNIVVNTIPKRLVIVHGSAASTQALADYWRDPSVQVTKEIYTPSIGEILNVSSGVNVYKAKLTDALLRHVRMTQVQGSMVGFVSGRIRYTHGDKVPMLDVDIDAAAGLSNAWQPPVLVGDPRLSALRAVLDSRGIAAHFDSEGTLVCAGAVAIKRVPSKRTGADAIRIIGNPTPQCNLIRSVVASTLAAL